MEKYLIAEFETYAREPIIRKMPDGSLICTFLTGDETEPRNGNFVAVCRSNDGGKTWSKPTELFNHPTRGVWCTEIFCGGEYPMAVVQTYNADCHYRELTTYYSITTDNGKNWSEPKSFRGAMNGVSLRQGFVMSNGEYLFPLYWQEVQGSFTKETHWECEDWDFKCGAGISADKGETWQICGYISDDDCLWEPNAIEVENGHIVMYCRSPKRYLYMSESFDYGRTWSKPIQTNIPNSDTKLTLLKVNETILLITNFDRQKRAHLAIQKSNDGKNFSEITLIEDEDALFYYPHAFADEDERTLYIAYENAKQHYLAKINFDELGL